MKYNATAVLLLFIIICLSCCTTPDSGNSEAQHKKESKELLTIELISGTTGTIRTKGICSDKK
ncbi:hypothetical protein [Paenibacillus harenae]|uniref:Uncharacterized protein n=1 Tax=Paenibacillus harenae TaxID=306543 RepID=A0ABT9U786_PAEHA|nr:hypothetical protein [Paenibacillus harenae]MDQ0115506.1 hypothetical protein [Paenibacillus harenae]